MIDDGIYFDPFGPYDVSSVLVHGEDSKIDVHKQFELIGLIDANEFLCDFGVDVVANEIAAEMVETAPAMFELLFGERPHALPEASGHILKVHFERQLLPLLDRAGYRNDVAVLQAAQEFNLVVQLLQLVVLEPSHQPDSRRGIWRTPAERVTS